MKKRLICSLLSVLGVFAVLSCSACRGKDFMDGVLAEPEDNPLEFWLVDNVASVDLTGYDRFDGMGCWVFYGKDYKAERSTDDNGYSIRKEPEEYIRYKVTAYPDYAMGGSYVTGIEITDPKITVYGLSCTSTTDELKAALTPLGFEMEEDWAAVWGKMRVTLNKGSLTFSVRVANRSGLIF